MKKLIKQLESLKSERVTLRNQEEFVAANKLNFPIDIIEEEIKEKQDRIDIFANSYLKGAISDTNFSATKQETATWAYDQAEAMEEERQKRIDKLYNK